MFEVDFLPVGDGKDSGDAIAIRFTRPDTGGYAVVTIDAGFKDDGEELVKHVQSYYGTTTVDLAILTHPDGDHIGGMGEVVRGLNVRELWLHRIGAHGGESLPAADAVEDLITVANENGTRVREAWAGAQVFGDALTVLGPDRGYYDQLVAEQLTEAAERAYAVVGKRALLEAARGLWDRVAASMPIEVPFVEKHVNARNNSSMIILLSVDGRRLLFTADAGVPAMERAWEFAEGVGLAGELRFVQIPHHGSRRNASSAWLTRLLGQPYHSERNKTAFVSVAAGSDKHPSGRVINAYSRRGCDVGATAGKPIRHGHHAPRRDGWTSLVPLGPMVEEPDDDD